MNGRTSVEKLPSTFAHSANVVTALDGRRRMG
jgi:hypothetical protein